MLRLTLRTKPEASWEEVGRAIMNFTMKYCSYKCYAGRCLDGVEIEINGDLPWNEARTLIDTFTTILRNEGINAEVSGVKFG